MITITVSAFYRNPIVRMKVDTTATTGVTTVTNPTTGDTTTEATDPNTLLTMENIKQLIYDRMTLSE